MKVELMANSATLARVVSMPAWRATISSLPMTRAARPSRDRSISQPIRKTTAASASSCQ